MYELIIGLFIFYAPSLLIAREAWLDYRIGKLSKKDIGDYAFLAIVPILNWIIGIGAVPNIIKYGSDGELKNCIIDLNTPYKCECGITSRKYQLVEYGEIFKCPHCDNSLYYSSLDCYHRKLPFAPLIKKREVLKLLSKKVNLDKIILKMKESEEYDKELEAWQNLQLKKMEEYQRKAEEIKKELSSDNKIFGKMKWINDEL